MTEGILERLREGVVLGDGGYLLELERRGYIQAGPFVPEPSIAKPGALAELHREFVDAGAEVIQTLTFYASEDKLATVGLEGKVDEMNRAAVRIAREVADEAEGDVLVAGNLSLTWAYDPESAASHRRVRETFDRQLDVMAEGGVDFVIAETFGWLGEASIAADAIRATGLAAMVTMAPDNDPSSYEGHSMGECAKRLAGRGVGIVGVNCLRSPHHVYGIMEEVRDAVSDVPDVSLASQPVAYHGHDHRPNFCSTPEFPYELERLQLPRAPFAEFAVRAREMGYRYIGSCCGSVASHVREMARALGKLPAEEREWRTGKAQSGYELHRMNGE